MTHYRTVLRASRDPDDCRRSLYLLDCGHTVSRRSKLDGKFKAVCGICQQWQADVDEIEAQIALLRERRLALDAEQYAYAEIIAAAMTGELNDGN